MDPTRRSRVWTAPQRAVLIGFVLLLAGYLGFRLYLDRSYVTNPQRGEGSRAVEVLDRIDPNTADLATLSLLPGLGEKRAREIIGYREEFHRTRPNAVAFQTRQDLLKVKGIGVGMVDNLAPYLSFPTTEPVELSPGAAPGPEQ